MIENFSVPVAPLNQQRRIVAKIENLRARTARARHELNLMPKLIERYKQAIIAKAFCGELTGAWRTQGSKIRSCLLLLKDRQRVVKDANG